MVQAEWNGFKWEVSQNKVNPVKLLEIDTGARTETDSEKDQTVFIGRSLETVRLSYGSALSVGGKPMKELETLQGMIKKSAPLYVGTEQIGENDFFLKAVELSDTILSNDGIVIAATLTLDFIEDSTKANESGIKIVYNGKDISKKVAIAECWIDQYAEDHADIAEIRFNDPDKKWDSWAKEGMTGNEISVEYGAIKTGKMFVHSVRPDGPVFVLKAMSIPPGAMNPTSKSWQSVTLEMIAKEIADRQGLTLKTFDTKNIKREYVRQYNTLDLVFLSERCKLEGAAFLVYNGALILYDEAKREAVKAQKILMIDGSTTTFSADDNTAKAYAKCTVDNGKYRGSYADGGMTGNAELLKNMDDKMASKGEAEGIAKGLLRQKNKYRNTAIVDRDLYTLVSAGSTVMISTKKATSWATDVYVYHIRHSLVKNRSKIWVRKILAW